MNILKYVKNQFATLNGRLLLNAPEIEKRVASSGDTISNGEAELAVIGGPAHLVTSQLINGNHKPTLDLDFPAVLEESATPGHYHLFLDKELSPIQYEKLLKVLLDVGILERGVYELQWQSEGSTFVRLPGTKKRMHGEEDRVKPGSYTPDQKPF